MSPRPVKKIIRHKGPPRLTATMFYKYLRCPHWVYWDIYGDADDKAEVNAITEKIWEHGVIHEKEVVAHYGDYDEVEEDAPEDDRVRRTLELMKQGSRIIYHGLLMDANWVGVPDLLLRASLPLGRRSAFGDYIYEPYDIKSAHIERPEDARDEYKFQLAFYALILEKLQGVRPEYGHLIDAERRVTDIRINDVLDEFHLTLREIEKIMAGEKPAPFLASACKESPWFKKCKLDAETCDDICLIYKIRRSDHAKLYAAGVKTVTELAAADIGDLEQSVEGMSRRKLEALQRQAQALHEKKMIVIQKNPLPGAPTEVYFDIEGDPLRGVEYLFGLLVVNGTRAKGKYEYFLAPVPEDEKTAWHEFLAFVKNLPDDAPVFHYGTYERTVVSRLANRYGGDQEAIDKLERQMFNLLTTVCESVALPVYFYSLKDIAKSLDFRWRHKEAGGANSITWYEDYLQLKDSKKTAAKAKKILQDIIDYNEDDVRATLFLKRWLDELPEPK
jgi:predicted RecB family nuclease